MSKTFCDWDNEHKNVGFHNDSFLYAIAAWDASREGMVPLDEVIEAKGLLSRLVHDIETPSKWGLADRVNPDWQTFNEAKEYILKQKYGVKR